MPDGSVLPLFAWLSPGYPVGGYAYSHGLEWAVEAGDVTNQASLVSWLADLLQEGAGRNDAVLLCAAHGLVTAGDFSGLPELNDLALALAPSRELRLETRQQGRSFFDATLAAWPAPLLAQAAGVLDGEVAYPVSVGVAAAAHRVSLETTLEAFLLAFVQNLVSAALRLAPIGQTAGTQAVAHLAPQVAALARRAPGLTLEDLGSARFRADLGSFRHETQYTRLFRS